MRRAAVLLLVLLATGCGGSATKVASQPQVETIKKGLVARLKHDQLVFRWVACVHNGRHYDGMPIVRCNVNFGIDPHIEAYCIVLDHGRLITNHENRKIPCGHDDAGAPNSIVQSS